MYGRPGRARELLSLLAVRDLLVPQNRERLKSRDVLLQELLAVARPSARQRRGFDRGGDGRTEAGGAGD